MFLKNIQNAKVLHKVVREELSVFDQKVKDQLKTHIPFIDRSLYIFLSTKKRYIYPTLVFLAARMCHKVTALTHRSAVLIFLLESVILAHIKVDSSVPFCARILFKWQNKIGTLLGDFFLAQGLTFSIEHEDFEILMIISEIVQNMSEAQLLEQSMKTDNLYSVQNYLQLVKKKNGGLFSESCRIGGLSVLASESHLEKLKEIGQALGTAFTLQNDLKRIKPKLYTRKNYLVNLPCLYALSQNNMFINLINKDRLKTKEQHKIFNLLQKTDAVTYTISEIQKQLNKAKQILKTFDVTPAQKAFLSMTLSQS